MRSTVVCLLSFLSVVPAFGAQIKPLDSACRLLDTRSGSPLSASTVYEVDVRGNCGIPEDATAIVFNLAVASPAAQGHLRAYGTVTLTSTSIINYNFGEAIVATGATVALSTDDPSTSEYDLPSWGIRLWSNQQTHVILDVTAYVTELATTSFRGQILASQVNAFPDAVVWDLSGTDLHLVCLAPWVSDVDDECGGKAINDLVCGTAHIDTYDDDEGPFDPGPHLFVHELVECE